MNEPKWTNEFKQSESGIYVPEDHQEPYRPNFPPKLDGELQGTPTPTTQGDGPWEYRRYTNKKGWLV